MEFAFVLGLIPLVLVLAIPVLIGVYVYRDAARRGMNAALWTLITILAPALVGFIIYLLVRGSYSDLQCPSCMNTVTEQYVVCPKCGAKLKASCPRCGLAVETEWTVCPKCAADLPEQQGGFTPPFKKRDTALGKILVAVIFIPVLLMVLLAVFSFSSGGRVSSSSMTYFSVDDYKDYPEIIAWIDRCDENPSKIYALSYQVDRGEQKATNYLIYRPSATRTDSVNTHNNWGLFGLDIEVKFYESPDPARNEDKLTSISNYSSKYAGLKVYVNGKKEECEITEIDFNPALFGSTTSGAPTNVPASGE